MAGPGSPCHLPFHGNSYGFVASQPRTWLGQVRLQPAFCHPGSFPEVFRVRGREFQVAVSRSGLQSWIDDELALHSTVTQSALDATLEGVGACRLRDKFNG
jgi:hypothetical protein